MAGPFIIVILAALAATGAILSRRRIREYIEREDRLDDDMIRRIEQDGSIEIEDATDMEQVRLEEERFWSETWDLPDEE